MRSTVLIVLAILIIEVEIVVSREWYVKAPVHGAVQGALRPSCPSSEFSFPNDVVHQ